MLTPELERLLEPLEHFEAIRRRMVRKGDRLVDLSYANPYGGVQEAARAAIRKALEEDRTLSLQYSPFGGQTLSRRAVADALRRSHNLNFAFDDVTLTPGAMGAIQLALHTVARPGGEVIVPIPCWLDYPLYCRYLGLKPILVPLAPERFGLDTEAIAAALSKQTCAVLLSHPANPTGRAYGVAALAELGEALREAESRLGSQVTLIADETHRDFTPPGAYTSATDAFERLLIVYSFGKYHFMQGQRLGYIAVSPRHPERSQIGAELVRWTRVTGLATPTAVMQRALPDLLALRHDGDWLVRWRARFVQELADRGYRVVRPDATLFVYVGTPPGYKDFEFVEQLAREGVLALPGPVFHHSSFFRLSLTGSEEMLERALPALLRLGPG